MRQAPCLSGNNANIILVFSDVIDTHAVTARVFVIVSNIILSCLLIAGKASPLFLFVARKNALVDNSFGDVINTRAEKASVFVIV